MSEQKTVFISYRRQPARYLARAIYQDLRSHGYDVFFDVESINSGEFDRIILRQIPARAHFIILLTPGTLPRCQNTGDWVLRELQEAFDTGRNIVPIFVEDFDWGDIDAYLPDDIGGRLSKQNAIPLIHDYFEAAMGRLRTRHLKMPEYIETKAIDDEDQAEVNKRIQEVDAQPKVTDVELIAEEYFRIAFIQADNQQYAEAIENYTHAIKLKPDYAEAYSNRGGLKVECGENESALEDINKAIEFNPNAVLAYSNRGAIHQKAGDIDSALADFDKAIELDPAYATGYLNRGITKHDYDNEGALADYNKAIELNPRFGNAYINRGNLRDRMGDLLGALADHENAVALTNNRESLAIAYYNRGVTHQRLDNLEQAIQDFSKTIELNPQNFESYLNRGVTKYNLGFRQAALADYDDCLEIKPDFAAAYNNRGIVKSELGDSQGAIADYSKAIELDPDFAAAYNNRGREKMILNDYENAIADFSKILDMEPSNESARENLEIAKRVHNEAKDKLL